MASSLSQRRRSPASLVLARLDVPLRQVAAALGVSVASVSAQLAGKRPADVCLIPVVRALADDNAAVEIERLLEGDQ
jgi:hypothetical protein